MSISVWITYFNPRAPCGARRMRRRPRRSPLQFQSTRPMRGATGKASRSTGIASNFNPRAPCGARPSPRAARAASQRISIHAPHAGRDATPIPLSMSAYTFQSTRPMRGATSSSYRRRGHGSDFNPRAPCGARLARPPGGGGGEIFQSTRPMRGATGGIPPALCRDDISIHAPHAGRDSPPASLVSTGQRISIHAPHAGRDRRRERRERPHNAFQSTRPMRGAT